MANTTKDQQRPISFDAFSWDQFWECIGEMLADNPEHDEWLLGDASPIDNAVHTFSKMAWEVWG